MNSQFVAIVIMISTSFRFVHYTGEGYRGNSEVDEHLKAWMKTTAVKLFRPVPNIGALGFSTLGKHKEPLAFQLWATTRSPWLFSLGHAGTGQRSFTADQQG